MARSWLCKCAGLWATYATKTVRTSARFSGEISVFSNSITLLLFFFFHPRQRKIRNSQSTRRVAPVGTASRIMSSVKSGIQNGHDSPEIRRYGLSTQSLKYSRYACLVYSVTLLGHVRKGENSLNLQKNRKNSCSTKAWSRYSRSTWTNFIRRTMCACTPCWHWTAFAMEISAGRRSLKSLCFSRSSICSAGTYRTNSSRPSWNS